MARNGTRFLLELRIRTEIMNFGIKISVSLLDKVIDLETRSILCKKST